MKGALVEEYEVELMDYLRVIWKRKLIIIITFVAAVLSAYFASTALSPVYQVKTSLLLLPPLASELDAAAAGSTLAPNAYKELAVSTTVLDSVLSSGDAPPEMDIWGLRGHLEVTVEQFGVSNSTSSQILLKVTVSGSDREFPVWLAKEWIKAFSKTFGKLFQDRTTGSYEYISENAASVQQELDAAMASRTELLLQHPLDTLQSDLSSLRPMYQKEISDLEGLRIELAANTAYVAAMQEELALQDDVKVLERSLDPDTLAVLLQTGLPTQDYEDLLGLHVEEQVLNSIYTSLVSAIAYARAAGAKTQELINGLAGVVDEERRTIIAIQTEITETQAAIDSIDNRVQLLDDANTRLASKLLEAKIALVETPDPIRVIDEPIAPRGPIMPNKKMNIAVAGVLGLMVGVLLAFFIDYIAHAQQTGQQRESNGTDSGAREAQQVMHTDSSPSPRSEDENTP